MSGTDQQTRLFLGLMVEPEVGGRLARKSAAALDGEPGIRLYSPEDLHLTLVFLGAFPTHRVERLKGALQEEIRGLLAPELTLEQAVSFPSADQPRALAVRVGEEPDRAGRLAALRNRALQAALCTGWRPPRVERERPFQPHVTVARCKGGEAAELGPFLRHDMGARWLAVDVEVIESRPESAESRYRAIGNVPLVVRPD